MIKKVVVVDKDDQPIGLKTYDELRYEDIYRVSALWLTDLSGEYTLIAQRGLQEYNDPGKWMFAVAGTIEEGETYEENIIHETEEEIGLVVTDVKPVNKIYVDEGKHKFFVQYFAASVNKDTAKIILQEEEVADYQWIKITELLDQVRAQRDKFVPSIHQSLKAIGY